MFSFTVVALVAMAVEGISVPPKEKAVAAVVVAGLIYFRYAALLVGQA
jgi:hypothetical protein